MLLRSLRTYNRIRVFVLWESNMA